VKLGSLVCVLAKFFIEGHCQNQQFCSALSDDNVLFATLFANLHLVAGLRCSKMCFVFFYGTSLRRPLRSTYQPTSVLFTIGRYRRLRFDPFYFFVSWLARLLVRGRIVRVYHVGGWIVETLADVETSSWRVCLCGLIPPLCISSRFDSILHFCPKERKRKASE